MRSLLQLNGLGGNHLHNNPQVKMPSRIGYFQDYIEGSGDLPMPVHAMPDPRERWQRHTCQGTARDMLGPRLSGLSYWRFTQQSFIHQSFASWWAHALRSMAPCCSSDVASGNSVPGRTVHLNGFRVVSRRQASHCLALSLLLGPE